jgi:hypothetical protein
MMRPRTLLITVAAVVLLGVLAVAALRSVAPPPDAAPAAAPVADASPEAETTPAAPAAVAAVEPPPPWASAASGTEALALEAPPASPEDARRAAQMAELQQSMAVMLDDALARSAATSQHLRKALDTLEAMDDPAVKAQINLDALRHNLGVSDRMQEVARELQAQINLPRTPERQQRIEALQAEFATLQGQLRSDVARARPAAP